MSTGSIPCASSRRFELVASPRRFNAAACPAIIIWQARPYNSTSIDAGRTLQQPSAALRLRVQVQPRAFRIGTLPAHGSMRMEQAVQRVEAVGALHSDGWLPPCQLCVT